MKYMFLAIILLCVTILIYIQFSNKIREGLTFEEQKKNLIEQDKYYDYRKFPQTVPGGSDDVKFVDLSLDKTKMINTNPSANVNQSDIGKNIEKCRIIDKNNDCGLISQNDCGYCWHTDKIMYGDANGPSADVCPKNGWVPPGTQCCNRMSKKKRKSIMRYND